MHSLRDAERVVIFLFGIVLAWMGFSLVARPPTVLVPAEIATQWDSIWLANTPTACSVASRTWCGTSQEFLGCVKVTQGSRVWRVVAWVPASNMQRLPLAATGVCDLSYNAMWHIHPAVIDDYAACSDPKGDSVPSSIYCSNPNKKLSGTHLRFSRNLSGVDLETLLESKTVVSIMTWAPKHLVAAVMWQGSLIYPVNVRIQ